MAKFTVVQAIIAVVGLLIYYQYYRSRGFPPGPKQLPIVGNINALPPRNAPEYQHWLKFKEKYGPLSSITVMGQTIIIIHDQKAALDLMGKKANSARPKMEFAFKMCGFEDVFVSQEYNNTFRYRRKLFHQQLGTKAAVARFTDLEAVEARRFLLRILNDPSNLTRHIKTARAAVTLKMLYGYSIEQTESDPLIDLIGRMMANLLVAFVPGAWLVDAMPILKYLPDGFPGAKFKETARRWNKINQMVADVPYSFVQRQMENSSHRPSFVSNLIQQTTDSGKTEQEANLGSAKDHDIKWAASSMYLGGTDTTASTLGFFFLAMAKFPDVQRKAQEEIERAIGADRLPVFEDRQHLPYIDCVLMEVLRHFPVTPMGAPHVTQDAEVYRGYTIPKGAILYASLWWFAHDPEVYRDPDSFSPERYLEPRNEPDPKNMVFGYGRRVCPGRNFADSGLFLTIAQTLAAFNISKAANKDGVEIEGKVGASAGVLARPVDWVYKITPRSVKMADLIRSIDDQLLGSDAGHLNIPAI